MSTRNEILERMAANVEALGSWLSASLDDSRACPEYRDAATAVLESLAELRGRALELQQLPWGEFPAWVQWAARDLTGYWFGYECRPEVPDAGVEWCAVSGRVEALNVPPGGQIPWRDALQKRPATK